MAGLVFDESTYGLKQQTPESAKRIAELNEKLSKFVAQAHFSITAVKKRKMISRGALAACSLRFRSFLPSR